MVTWCLVPKLLLCLLSLQRYPTRGSKARATAAGEGDQLANSYKVVLPIVVGLLERSVSR